MDQHRMHHPLFVFSAFFKAQQILLRFAKRIYSSFNPIVLRLGSVHPLLTKGVKGFLFLALSVLLGMWADFHSQSTALRDWQNQNPPSLSVWTSVLRSKGFQAAQVRSLYHLVSAIHEEPQGVWFSADGQWVLLFVEQPRLWTLHSAVNPHSLSRAFSKQTVGQWEYLGQGWVGFQELLSRLSRKGVTVSKPIKTASQDFRELRY